MSPDTWQHYAPFFWFGVLVFGVAATMAASTARRSVEELRDAARDRHPSTWEGGGTNEKR